MWHCSSPIQMLCCFLINSNSALCNGRNKLTVCQYAFFTVHSYKEKKMCITTRCPKHYFTFRLLKLTFKNRASCILDGRTATLQMLHFIYFFSTTVSIEYFKHAAHSPFFSSKCRLFHNATIFGSCIIHILHTGCAKI
jgi:hypothetical protein